MGLLDRDDESRPLVRATVAPGCRRRDSRELAVRHLVTDDLEEASGEANVRRLPAAVGALEVHRAVSVDTRVPLDVHRRGRGLADARASTCRPPSPKGSKTMT